MGWSFMHRERGTTNEAFFAREFPSCEILACATVKGTFYAAMCLRADRTVVFGMVCLTQFCRGDYNFGYKDLDETMGPYADDCPARVLDWLTPTDNATANEWRARCRAKASKPVPRIGEWIRLARPVRFGSDIETDTLQKASLPRRKNIFRTKEGNYVRFTNFKNYEYTICQSV